MSLYRAFRAGRVLRWHANPEFSDTNDRIDGHAARVARIILMWHPEPSLALIKVALTHDDGEIMTGDIPYTVKRHMPTMARDWLDNAEAIEIRSIWGQPPRTGGQNAIWVQFADRLDAWMWAHHHRRGMMHGSGWPEAWAWLAQYADMLGVRAKLEELREEMRDAAS